MTIDTRRAAHEEIKPKKQERCDLILEVLGVQQMTAEDIVDELIRLGHIKYYDRNFVAPRLTELRDAGIVETVGKRKSRRSKKQIAIWQRKRDKHDERNIV